MLNIDLRQLTKDVLYLVLLSLKYVYTYTKSKYEGSKEKEDQQATVLQKTTRSALMRCCSVITPQLQK